MFYLNFSSHLLPKSIQGDFNTRHRISKALRGGTWEFKGRVPCGRYFEGLDLNKKCNYLIT